MPATDHGERIGARKVTCSRHFGYGLFAGVDKVWVFLPFHRVRSDSEHAVFALQHDLDSLGNVVGDERRHADTQVHIESIAQFARNAFHDAFAFVEIFGHKETRSIPFTGRRPQTAGARPMTRLAWSPFSFQSGARKAHLAKSASRRYWGYVCNRDRVRRPPAGFRLRQS